MPYEETHTISVGPITLPPGVTVYVVGGPGQQTVQIAGTTSTSKDDTATLLEEAFALLMTAASGEGVGQPVFVTPAPPIKPAA